MSVLLDRPRLMLSLALMLSGAGLVAWFHMPREEDPRLAERFGIIIAPYPGAEPGSVEERVVKPIEDELSEVEAIDHVDVTIRTGIAVFRIALRGDVGGDQTDRAWDEVEDALTAARREMPESALEPILDERQVETESVVVALTGGTDRVALAESADALEDRLLALADVSRVVISGDPGERITVDYDDATARRVGLDPLSLANVLQSHNSTTPGGSLRVGAREVPVRPLGELETVEAIEELPVPTRSGAVRLGDIANVRRTVNEPASVRVRHNGDEAVIVGAVSREGLKAEDFGAAVREVVDDFAEANPELGVTYVAFQPERVAARLGELGGSLLLGVGIVAGVLLLFMGFRMGLVVASVVPLVTLAGLAVYAGTGGVLHQMAVAALVLALGLLVDNAIVVAETIQRRLDAGASGNEAVQATLRELAIPLAAATGTTLASFLPMLLAEGTVGDFTRAIPVVTILTLIVSYAYALVVTPALAKFGLRPGKAATSRLDEFGAMVGGFGARHPGRTLAAALLIVGVCGAFATQVRINFFPSSDRNQVVVEVELPEGTHLDQTDDASRRLEGMLASLPEVTGVTTFVGRNVPKFYYNLPVRPASPHLAQLIVTTRDASSVADVIRRAEAFEGDVDAMVIARRLEQGPPILAPIEVRLRGPELADLTFASNEVRRILRSIEGTRHVRSDEGPGIATLRYLTDDAAAGRQRTHRQAVALALLGTSRGIPAGMYRGEEDPMPIVVRSALRPSGTRGDRLSPDELSAADVPRPGASPVPLLQVASRDVRWEPAVIHRRDRSRAIHVRSQHADDVTYESIVAEARPRLERLDFPGGVTWEFGGVVADSAKANKALGANAPWAALLLIAILLAQFNSFRRTLIVLATAPLAALGIWPGLFIADLPFGFVALLGAIALIGIAVNGAIVLLDVADRRRREGATLEEALVEAVRLRTRPIVLTTATTVAGLVPLLFSQSTLWPPMAAAMISGLVVSTLLTLGVVPALYRLFFRPPKMPKAAVAAAVLAIAAPVAAQDSFDLEGSIHGDEPSVELSEAASRVVARSPQIEAAQATIRAAEAELRAVRVALAPRLTVGARYSRINRINNDPLVPGNDPEQSAAARRLAEGVDDPEARALFTGFLDQLDGLANTEIRVPRNQYALTAGVLFPVSSILAAVLPRYRGARQLVRVREAEERATRQGLELQTAEIFYALVRARSFRALSRHQRQRAQDQLTRVQAAVRAGSAPELDEVRMQGQVAAVEIALTQSDAAVAIASDAFQTLLGIEGDRSPAVELGTPPAASPVPLPQLVSRAYEARPEADALRAAVRAQRLVARGARADRYPVLALSANAQLANPNLNYVPVRDRFDSNWDVSVVLQWSPSDVGRGNAQAAAAEARAAEAVAHLRALEDGIRNEVTGAYHALRAASLSHQLAERGLRAAEATYRSTQRRWQEGSGPLGAVVDADAELTSAEVQQIDAALDAYVAAARLRFAVGESVSR